MATLALMEPSKDVNCAGREELLALLVAWRATIAPQRAKIAR